MSPVKFSLTGVNDICPIIDMHGHMGAWDGFNMPRFHPTEIIEDMRRFDVRLLIFSHHKALSVADDCNSSSMDVVREFPDYFRAYAVFNPNVPETHVCTKKQVECLSDVFCGYKLHGTWHQTPYDHKNYTPVWEHASAQKVPVLIHSWGNCVFTGQDVVDRVANRFPDVSIIAAHSFHGCWETAIMMAEKHSNLYLDLCAVLDDRENIVERFIDRLGSERILFGTDIPWFNYEYYLGALLGCKISLEDLKNILYLNSQRLFKLPSYT